MKFAFCFAQILNFIIPAPCTLTKVVIRFSGFWENNFVWNRKTKHLLMDLLPTHLDFFLIFPFYSEILKSIRTWNLCVGKIEITLVGTIADICHIHTTGSGALFRDDVLFCIENAKFWPILAHFDQFGLLCSEFARFLVYFLQALI